MNALVSDREVFLPSVWEGQVTIYGQKLNIILNTTVSSNSSKVIGDLEIGNAVIPVSGTYASTFKVLNLDTTKKFPLIIAGRNITVDNLQMQESSELYMSGSLIGNDKQKYAASLNRKQGEFFMLISTIYWKYFSNRKCLVSIEWQFIFKCIWCYVMYIH